MPTIECEKLSLPKLDEEIKNIAEPKEVSAFFHLYEDFLESPHGEENCNVTQWTGFTVNDQTFSLAAPMDTVNPIHSDPVTQRLILAAQVSNGKVNKDDSAISGEGLKVQMLNGKEINLVKKDGKLMANDMEVNDVISSGNATIFVLEYFLFVSSSDICDGIGRIHKREGVVHTPWGSHPYVEDNSPTGQSD
ncbi:uncharacterized protein [Lepeophtheirus salmonis]|uniref:Uncharacterized protein n=1 Tax=Lepeophtheirus salmonis TaxID=72036 RepID=A0A0K2UM84_LEPSM|nr:uncharacterized protein LOC121118281 [Lepeophtheirus salmonis]XP_040568785.1 uncharacterized protein LOC121118281 [Lepeophtheirus salmonis]